MKILVACEYSGTVRDELIKLGHDAVSCDLLPTESPGPHIQDDVLLHLDTGEWDMMIAFPPCTYLTVANTYLKRGCSKYTKEEAEQLQHEAILFFFSLYDAPIEKIAIENPIGVMSRILRKPDQIIQPWMFGHPESKSTCLWLKNLPLLQSTKYADFTHYRCKCGYVFEESLGKYGCANCGGQYAAKPLWNNQTPSGQNKLGPSDDRWKIRSKTYTGIAQAMAKQWTENVVIQTNLF